MSAVRGSVVFSLFNRFMMKIMTIGEMLLEYKKSEPSTSVFSYSKEFKRRYKNVVDFPKFTLISRISRTIIHCLFKLSMNLLLICRSFTKVLLFISLIIPPILDITLNLQFILLYLKTIIHFKNRFKFSFFIFPSKELRYHKL